MADHNHTMLLSCDWGIPPSPHLIPIKFYGMGFGGNIVFGFHCRVCKNEFRSDFKDDGQFSEAMLKLVPWAIEHQHSDEDNDDADKRRIDTSDPDGEVQE